MIIGFTNAERSIVEKELELIDEGKILKFSYLNLNVCEVI
jgi:hypothetical protein